LIWKWNLVCDAKVKAGVDVSLNGEENINKKALS